MRQSLLSILAVLPLGLLAHVNSEIIPQSQDETYYPLSREEDKEQVMSDAYWQIWNPDVQQRIDRDIERNRKADYTLRFSDIDRRKPVEIRQVGHDFIFGAHIFNFNQLGSDEANERYKELYGTLFNSATVAFYWKTFETEPGRLRFRQEYWDTPTYWNECPNPKYQLHWRRPSTDQVVEFCESKHIRIHGHTLVWGNRKWQFPDWLYDQMMTSEEEAKLARMLKSKATLKNYKDGDVYTEEYQSLSPEQLSDTFPAFAKTLNEQFDLRIDRIARQYEGRINSWDVVNESASDYGKGNLKEGAALCKSEYGMMPGDYAYKALKRAQRDFPAQVKLNINDYSMGNNYVDEVCDLQKRGCKIDIMGAQMHLFNPKDCMAIAEGKEIQTPTSIWDWTSRFQKTGLPIHLSEITITCPEQTRRGRYIQAIIAYNLYRLWFSVGNMMGITWWNVVDDCGAPGEPSTSGLFDRQMNPKPSYNALNHLINEVWRTSLTQQADSQKALQFRGFKGTYEVTWTNRKGKKVTKTVHLAPDGTTDL